MKKIFLTLAVTTLIFSAKAQSNQKSTSQSLASSIANNTTQENPRDPYVNGIPYSQYKIQVQNDEKHRSAKDAQAKIKNKELIDNQAKITLPSNPNVAEKTKH